MPSPSPSLSLSLCLILFLSFSLSFSNFSFIFISLSFGLSTLYIPFVLCLIPPFVHHRPARRQPPFPPIVLVSLSIVFRRISL